MARPRNAPVEESPATHYAWSNLYLGGESEMRQDRKIVQSHNIIPAGKEVSVGDFDLSQEQFDAWKADGVIREYPHPDGYIDEDGNPSEAAIGMSPYSFVLEQRRAELEAAESDAEAETPEDMLLRASLANAHVVGPRPEEVLLGQTEPTERPELPENVEEPEPPPPPPDPDQPVEEPVEEDS